METFHRADDQCVAMPLGGRVGAFGSMEDHEASRFETGTSLPPCSDEQPAARFMTPQTASILNILECGSTKLNRPRWPETSGVVSRSPSRHGRIIRKMP